MSQHQYLERDSGRVRTERLVGDRMIRALYGPAREHAPGMFRLFTSARSSSLLAGLNYDLPLRSPRAMAAGLGIDTSEFLDPVESVDTARKLFERKIRYEQCRPMPEATGVAVSPADARVLVGSLRETSRLFLKEKFFVFGELLGAHQAEWLDTFRDGDYAVFRLTPDKYHYNHVPVAGRVADFYELDGGFHSCNPAAVVAMATPFSCNRRVVTVLDTDVPGGTGVGFVAMIEVVALMIGSVMQCYSAVGYEEPRPLEKGMFLAKGQPKSLYRPGSSTDVVLFQPGRIRFAEDLVRNLSHPAAQSRFTLGFGRPLVETDLKVRSPLATVQRG